MHRTAYSVYHHAACSFVLSGYLSSCPFGFDAIVPQLEEAIGVARKSWVVELNTELAARDAREHDLVALLKQAHTFHIVRVAESVRPRA